MSIDLDAYFERIGWRDTTTASYRTLAGLVEAHVTRIPFENLDVLLGRPIRLDDDSLQAKLVTGRRGGYCFEHASLFARVLEQLGFDCARHSARVVMLRPAHLAARTHMFLTVNLPQGTFVADPGFGAHAPRVPVPLVEAAQAHHGSDVHWMTRAHGLWTLHTREGERIVDCWASDCARDNLIDFEVSNHYVATHPDSSFVNRLMLRGFTVDGTSMSIMNREVTRRRGNESSTTVISDRKALRDMLARDLGLDVPEIETLRVPAIPEWQ